ncbi:dissimilatory sulfite reductase subunit E [Vulcanisaeta moutnovskia 768-28]|uniref:Dissimilatory sulfite reductase subunit E n=1 Tax=Vulcanisaeta moutnovskia (strain 768-28) TaxID=985053 RepID=F0QUQ0_VULM7|nr:DsrE family protein [Vulcanisaeta moutnovskia]ADY00711.1 dissimilatory sulfite reductase subunit E [Vulcanisaeta moutnovskia 768-28]
MSRNKDRVIFFTTMSPSEEDRIQAVLRLALIASSLGYEAFIYLALHSVVMAKRNVFEKLSNATKDMLRNAMKSNVKIMACKVAMEGFNVKKEELIDGVSIAEPKDLFEIAKGSIILSW